METLLSYFYSTIPQVLATAIGLVGVFVLYKLNLIKQTLVGLAESMVFEIQNNSNYSDMERADNKDNIRRLEIGAKQGNPYKMKRILYDIYNYFRNKGHTNMYEQIIEPFENQIKTRDELLKSSKIILAYTGCLIFICVLIIPYIKSILNICSIYSTNQYNCLTIILLVIILLSFLVDLILIVRIVWKSLDDYNEIKTV